jgi:pyridoxal 5'-phosphate synthase pdxT subunit
VAGDRPVGVLALQGDFAAHARALGERGVACQEVRTAGDLVGLSGLILPGGESTTMLRLLGEAEAPLVAAVRHGLPVLATCAGVILIAREVSAPPQRSLGLLDVAIVRNAYGRQIDSRVVELEVVPGTGVSASHIEGVFIRAPRITSLGSTVQVLARREADPVLLRQGNILAATFHPELTPGSPVVDLFLRLVREA